jgi:hypothetical protein
VPRPKNIPKGDPYWHKKWLAQKASGEADRDALRAKARAEYDKAGIDRKGKDIDHKKKLAAGGTSARSNLRLRDSSENQADNRHKKGEAAGKKRKVRVVFKP